MTSSHPSTSARRVLGTLILLAVLALMAMPASAEPILIPPEIGLIEITDVRDGSFFISWVTNLPSDGTVNCYDASNTTLIQSAEDDLDNVTTHFVRLGGFNPATTYRCEIVSGGTVDNNGGDRYPVTTGQDLGLPASGDNVDGTVYLHGGTTLSEDAVVYLRLIDKNASGSLGTSQWVAARVEGGYWEIVLGNIRTTDGSAYFTYTKGADEIEYWVQGGADGTWGRDAGLEAVITIPASLPASLDDAELNGSPMPLAVTLNSFAASGQTDGILVTWETTSEVDAQGFNLYRATTPAAAQELLGFVPAQAPGSTAGAAYQWLDSAVTAGAPYYYWLEAIDLAGATSLHGPVSATMQTPTAVTLTSVSASPAAASALPWLWAAAASAGAALVLTRRRR